jgi:hypothetical protein
MLSLSLGVAVIAAWVAGAKVDYARLPAPDIQPHAAAFGIWLVIFPGLFLAATGAGASSFPRRAATALTTSLALACGWALVLTTGQRRPRAEWRWWHGLAALVLVAAAQQAWRAAARLPAADETSWRARSARVAVGVYAGWLVVAVALALAMAQPALDTPWALAVGSLGVAAAAVRLSQPYACAAVAWAAALQREHSLATGLALATALVGGAVAM